MYNFSFIVYHLLFNFGFRTQEASNHSNEPSVQSKTPEVDIQNLNDASPTSLSKQGPDPRNWRNIGADILSEWRPAISFTADVYLCK